MIEIAVSLGGVSERSSSIKVNLNENATGEFVFKYYIDGTKIKEETKDLSLTDSIEWSFKNSDVHEYAIRVKSTKTGAEGLLLRCEVDFTKDPPTRDFGDSFNSKVFKQLLSAVPSDSTQAQDNEAEEDEGSEESVEVPVDDEEETEEEDESARDDEVSGEE